MQQAPDRTIWERIPELQYIGNLIGGTIGGVAAVLLTQPAPYGSGQLIANIAIMLLASLIIFALMFRNLGDISKRWLPCLGFSLLFSGLGIKLEPPTGVSSYLWSVDHSLAANFPTYMTIVGVLVLLVGPMQPSCPQPQA